MHHLHNLDHLLSKAFHLPAAPHHTVHPVECSRLLAQALEEAEQVRDVLLKQAFEKKHKKEMKVFVQTYQSVCIYLCNKINNGTHAIQNLACSAHAINNILHMQQHILSHLIELLNFLKSHFSNYFDATQQVPVVLSAGLSVQMENKAIFLSGHLKHWDDDKLVKIILAPIKSFCDSALHYPCTYQQHETMQNYMAAIVQVVENKEEKDFRIALLFACIEIDYCPQGFLSYIISYHNEKLSGEENKSWWKEKLKQLETVKTREANQKDWPVKLIVMQAFQNEIKGIDHPQSSGDEPSSSISEPKVFQTPMSVSQLALFIRLLVESGTIKSHNQALLIRTVAASFSTAKTKIISSESLRSKYYATDPASVNIVKDYIIRMMNQLRQL